MNRPCRCMPPQLIWLEKSTPAALKYQQTFSLTSYSHGGDTTGVQQCIPQTVPAPRGGHVISISNGSYMISVWNLAAPLLLSFLVFVYHVISHVTGDIYSCFMLTFFSCPTFMGCCWVKSDSEEGLYSLNVRGKMGMLAASHKWGRGGGSMDCNSATVAKGGGVLGLVREQLRVMEKQWFSPIETKCIVGPNSQMITW